MGRTEQEKRSLDELKKLVQEAIDDGNSSNQLQEEEAYVVVQDVEEEEERIPLLTKSDESSSSAVLDESDSIWGVPLLKDERSDIILSKFLEDNNFRVKDTLEKIKNTLKWRKLFEIEKLLLEDLDLEEIYYTHGRDKEGRPVCYTVGVDKFPGIRDKETSRERFLRSWILSLEKMIRKLVPFLPCQPNAILLVNDLANWHSSWRGELDLLVHHLDEYYPQSIANQVFVNESWYATESKSKYIGESGTLDTLYKYISPEQLPVHYGGLSSGVPDDAIPVFTTCDPPVEEVTLGGWQCIKCAFIQSQKCVHVWELRRIGASHTSYEVYFVPKSARDPVVVVQANCRVRTKERVVSGYYRASSPGTLVIYVDNFSFSKKKVVIRHKSLPYYSQLSRPPTYFICHGTGKLYTPTTFLVDTYSSTLISSHTTIIR